MANITDSYDWLTYLITCNAGSASSYKKYTILVSFYCGSPNELIIDVIDSQGSQYNTLKPDSWATDGSYLYLKRLSGVSFSCLPIGRESADRLIWSVGYPSSPTIIEPTVKFTAQDIPAFYKDYSTLAALTTAVRGVPAIGAWKDVQDFDNITETCWSYIWSNNYGLMPVVTFVQDASAFQIYIRDRVHIDFRYKWAGYWTEWFTIV